MNQVKERIENLDERLESLRRSL